MDARNPLFFYASDLEQYIRDVASQGKKEFMLLINKSDFLSEDLVKHWNAYFTERNIKHLFFSALLEQDILDCATDPQAEEDEEDGEPSTEAHKTLEQIKTEDAMQDTAKDTIFTREFIERDAID